MKQRSFYRFVIVFIQLIFLSLPSTISIPTVKAAPALKPLFAPDPLPSVNLNAPAYPFIGDALTITVTFDNIGSDTGYGPYIDLFLPLSGADGLSGGGPNDGISFVSASYLGQSVTTNVLNCPAGSTVTHPLTGQTITCPAQPPGLYSPFTWQLVVITLPFGSFVPAQPPATVTVNANLSNYADLGVALPIQAQGGFMFGADPLNNPLTDPPITGSPVSTNVTPTLLTLSKSYNGPEDETATGPNFPRRYTVTAQIAPGQSMTAFNLTDVLPNNMQFVSLVSTNPAGASCTLPSTSTPGGTLSCNFSGSVSGTVTMTFEYYIPLRDSTNASVIDPITGDDATSCNNASAGGTWAIPLDPRDTGGTFTQNPAGCEHTLTDKSIAIQKSVSVVGGGIPKPGAVLEYTLNFQVSDFFAFQNVVVKDTISDGQHFDSSFTPTLQINGNGYTLIAAPMNAANYTVDTSQIGNTGPNPPPDGTDGSTTITFRVSDEIIARGQNGKLIGGCVPTGGTGSGDPNCNSYNDGPTTGTIVFRTVIQENFTDTYPSGDPSVDQGDILNDNVTINGDLLSTSDASTLTGRSEADTSAASVSIPRGTISKSIYALNGNTSIPSPVRIAPGDTVTYRITYTLPTSDFEDLVITDYLPLPIYSATEVTTFNNTACGIPLAGVSCLGPSNTFSGVTPTLTTNSAANSITWTYGDYDSSANSPSTIELLFTVTVNNQPFADGLYLTNLANAQEGSTNSSSSTSDAIVQVQLQEPVVGISKGVVWTNNPAGVFSPSTVGPVTFTGSGCPAFTGTITSPGLASNPVNSNLSGVDAGDQVMMAIILENTGRYSAFDVRVKDSLPAGMTLVSGSVCVTDGTGAAFTYSNVGGGTGLFDQGIELNDPGPTNLPAGALDPGKNPDGSSVNTGRNIAVITYLVTLNTSVQVGQTLTNTATLFNYAGTEGGPDHTGDDPTDTASVTITKPLLSKALTSTNQTFTTDPNVAVGEMVTYTVTITVPEGTTPNAVFSDTLDPGLAFVSCDSITASSSVSATGGFNCANAVISNNSGGIMESGEANARVLTYNFGDITNSDTDNSTPETITIQYTAVVLNSASINRGVGRNNAATFSWTGGSANASAPDVVIVEPTLQVNKTAAPTTGDAGDTITYTAVLSHTGASNADAFEAHLRDDLSTLPVTLNLASITVTPGAGCGSPTVTNNSTATMVDVTVTPFPLGCSVTVTYQVTLNGSVSPGQTIINTANIDWSSLPGNIGQQTPNNTLSCERTGNTAGCGGTNNDYTASDPATVTISSPQAAKTLVGTEINNAVNSSTQAVIGELVTYDLTLTIPEGITPNAVVTDTLDAGLAFVDCVSITPSSLLTTTLPGGFAAACNAPTNPTVSGGGQSVVFNLANITNADVVNSTPETITIRYTAVVLDVTGNQSGTQLNNSAVFSWTGNSLPAVSAPNVTVIEPTVNTGKVVVPTNTDAGNTVTFTVTLTNPVSSSTTAYDVTWSDTVPSGLTYTATTLSGSCITHTLTLSDTPTLTGSVSQLDPGETCTITFNATVDYSVTPGQVITNTAETRWTSLSGAVSDRSLYNTASDERTGADGLLHSGVLNDYRTQGQATVTINNVAPSKYLLATSEAHTGVVGGTERVAIGEIIRYRLVVQLPEGTSTNFQIRDYLPTGLTYLDDGTAKVAFVSNGAGITSTNYGTLPVPGITNPNCFLTGSTANGTTPAIPASCPALADNNVGSTNSTSTDVDTYNTGSDPYFKLGTLTNNDSDADAEYVILEFNALVDNTSPGSNDAGDARDNYFAVTINGTQNGPNSASVRVYIAEPDLRLSKSLLPPAPTDAGDAVTYELKITSLASGCQGSSGSANCATAFDLNLTDNFDANLTGLTVSSITTTQGATCVGNGGGTTVFSHNGGSFTGNNLTFTATCLDPGQTITLTITGTVAATAPAGYTIPNSATVTYTSLPGSNGASPNPTGSVTPGASGSGTGERNGSGGVNKYFVSASASAPLSAPQIDKRTPTPASAPIGATVTFPILVTLPEGVTQSLVVTDNLPVGLVYVSHSVVTTAAASGGLLTADYNGSFTNNPPTFTCAGACGSGDDISLDFGNVTTAADNVTNNNAFVIFVTARVNNELGNQNGTVLANTASLTYNDPDTGTTTLADPTAEKVTVLEPELNIVKSADDTTPAYGQTLTYTLTVSHLASSTSTAYDIVITDTIPAGLTYVAGSISAPAGWTTNDTAAPTLTWTCSAPCSLPVGNTASLSYQVTVNGPPGPPNPGDVLTNTASMTWTSLDGTDPNERTGADGVGGLNDYADSDPENVTLTYPDLTITKTDGGVTVTPGSVLTYTLTYTNVGNQGATGVILTETVPAHTTYTGSGWTCIPDNNAGSVCTFSVGALNAGASGSATFVVTVNATVPAGVTQIANTAIIGDDGTNGPDPTPADNSGSDTTPLEAAPDLQISKTDGGVTVTPGSVLTYTLTYTNVGNQGATGVILTETVPAHTTYTGSGWTCIPDNNAGSVCTFSVGALNAGASGSATFVVTVNTTVPAGVTQIANTAIIGNDGTNGPDPTPADNTSSEATPLEAAPDLTITKTDGGVSTMPGGVLTYTLTYTNVGNQGATGVILTETVPAHTTYTGSGWTCIPDNNAGSVCTFTVGTLNAGASGSVDFVLTVVNPVPLGVTQIANTAVIGDDGTNGPDPTPADNSGSDTTPLEAAPDLRISKTDGVLTYIPGGTLTYTITVTNIGPSDALGVSVTDNIPAQFTSWSWTCVTTGGATCTGSGGFITTNFSDTVDLPASAIITYTVAANLSISASGNLTNTVTVSHPADSTPGDNTASDTDGEGMDFGDLPSGYAITLLANGGARHRFSGLRLGNDISYEADGQESDLASSDSYDDGVTFSGNWSDGQGELKVTVSGGDGCLSAWLDFWDGTNFGADKTFDDNYEKIIDNQPVSNGSYSFTFNLPGNAANSATMFARFRIVPRDSNGTCSSSTAISWTGLAEGGEVEDYRLTFSPTSIGLLSLSARSERTLPFWLPLLMLLFGWGYTRLFPVGSAASFLAMRRKRAVKPKR